MSKYWNELNKYEEPSSYGLIPNGTIAKVRMAIKRGNYDDPEQGWLGGYATKSPISGSVFLDVEYTVLEGKYAKRKVWGLIGLSSASGPEWANMGKAFIKAIINSSKGISPKDTSEAAVAARSIESFKPLDGIEFVARIDVTKDPRGESRNEIRMAITPDHKDYSSTVRNAFALSSSQQQSAQSNNNVNYNRPDWV